MKRRLPSSSLNNYISSMEHLDILELIQSSSSDEIREGEIGESDVRIITPYRVQSQATSVTAVLQSYKNDLEEVRAGTALLDCWFIRARFQAKWDFINQAISRLTDRESITSLLLALNPPTKDVIYSTSQCTNLLEDILPLDDNRMMSKPVMQRALMSDLVWLTTLSNQQAVNILIGLIELGGTQLKMRAYYACLDMWNVIQEESLPAEDYTGAPVNNRKISKKKSVKRSLKESRVNASITRSETDLEKDLNLKVKQFDNYMDKMKRQLRRSRAMLKQQVTSSSEETIDWVRLLPVWIVLKIFNYLDKKTLQNVLTRVNSYWRTAVDKLLLEMKAKDSLTYAIKQLEPERFNARACYMERVRAKTLVDPTKFTDRRTRGRSERRPLSAVAGGSITMSVERSTMFLIMGNRAAARSSLLPLLDSKIYTATLLQTFSRRHKVVLVSVESPSDAQRISCSNQKYTVTTCKNFIIPFVIATGAPQPRIENPERSAVRCISMNPVDTRLMAVAYTDYSVKLWDIWTRTEIKNMRFRFLVTTLCSNEKYVVVGGSKVSILRWKDGKHVWHRDQNNEVSCSCLYNYTVFLGTIAGGIVMYPLNNIETNQPLVTPGKSKMILWCHFGTVTRLCSNDLLLISSGDDDYIRAWNASFNFRVTINARKFDSVVSDICVNLIYVIASTEDGKIYIWNALNDTILRHITINTDSMPVQSVSTYNYDNLSKIILTSDTGIKILIFNISQEVSEWATESVEKMISAITAEDSMKVNDTFKQKQVAGTNKVKSKPAIFKKMGSKPLTVRDLTIPNEDITGQTFIERPNVKKKNEMKQDLLERAQCTLPAARKGTDHCLVPITVENFAAEVEDWQDLSFFPRFIPILMKQQSFASPSKISLKNERTMKEMKDVLPLCSPYKFSS